MEATEILPRDHNAERYVIGVFVRYPDRAGEVLESGLDALDFVDQQHQQIYRVAQRQHASGGVDPVLLGRETATAGYLLELADEVTTSAHVPVYAAKIIEARRKRDLHDHHSTLAAHALNGWTAQQLLSADEVFHSDIKQAIEAGKQRDTYDFADLAEKFPSLKPPLIDGLARFGDTINIVAPTKVGKSWFVYHLIICILKGFWLFGRFACTPGSIVLCDNELHAETIVSRIKWVAEKMGVDLSALEHRLIVKTLRGRLRPFGHVAAELREQFQPGEIALFVFDAKYRFAQPGQSENDNAAEAMFYNEADCFAAAMQSAVAFVHHSTKGAQGEKRVSDIGAGAGSQSRAADVHAVFREHEDNDAFVFEALVRSFPPVEPIGLRWQFPLWVPANDVDPGKLKGRGTRNEERQNEKDNEGLEATRTALSDGTLSMRQLRRKTGMGEYRQSRLIDKLASLGEIESTTVKKGSIEYEIFSLKQ